MEKLRMVTQTCPRPHARARTNSLLFMETKKALQGVVPIIDTLENAIHQYAARASISKK